MNRKLLSVALGLAAATLASNALAAVNTAAQDEMIPSASVMMSGVPYGASGSDGQYIESGTSYNNAPVYERTGSDGTIWSLYKRTDGKWYVDFNAVSEDWDGTVAHSSQAQSWPWTNSWANSVASYRTVMVNVQNIPYATNAGSAGDYEETGEIYNGAPVYEHAGLNGITWSLYKRADGKWYVDFNDVSEAWDGTVAYSTSAAKWPWSASWNNASYVFTNTKIVYLNGLPYGQLGSNGDYTYSGTTYNNAPVYTRMVAGSPWSLYKRADGKWYVDGNAVGEAWDGTMAYTNAAQSSPWSGSSGSWANSVTAFRTARVSVQGAPYASIGSAGEYLASGQIYNGAPVYQRVAGSTTWSLYKRANGKWHVDFNAVSEDWDGTVAYTTVAMDMPWSSASWNASTVVEDLFAE